MSRDRMSGRWLSGGGGGGAGRLTPRFVDEWAATGTYANGSTMTCPTLGVVEGDLLLAQVSMAVDQSPTALSGFTTLLTRIAAGNATWKAHYLLAYRWVPSGGVASATLSATGSREGASIIRAYRNVDPTTPIGTLVELASLNVTGSECSTPAVPEQDPGGRIAYAMAFSGDVGVSNDGIRGAVDNKRISSFWTRAGMCDEAVEPDGGVPSGATFVTNGGTGVSWGITAVPLLGAVA